MLINLIRRITLTNELLNSLLKEYEQKKLKAEIESDNNKEILYKKVPKLRDIENNINQLAISTTKNILKNNNYSLDSLTKEIAILKKEKEKILKENNIDPLYLLPKYECTLCKDTGYIHTKNYQTEMCSCLKQKLLDISFNKSNMSNLDKENFSAFNEKLFSNEINFDSFGVNFSPRDNIVKIKDKSLEFVKNFDNPSYKNLLFTGNTGLRKNFFIKLYC